MYWTSVEWIIISKKRPEKMLKMSLSASAADSSASLDKKWHFICSDRVIKLSKREKYYWCVLFTLSIGKWLNDFIRYWFTFTTTGFKQLYIFMSTICQFVVTKKVYIDLSTFPVIYDKTFFSTMMISDQSVNSDFEYSDQILHN